jgi:hypothetical protein
MIEDHSQEIALDTIDEASAIALENIKSKQAESRRVKLSREIDEYQDSLVHKYRELDIHRIRGK